MDLQGGAGNPQYGASNPQAGAGMSNALQGNTLGVTNYPAGLIQGSNATDVQLTPPGQNTATDPNNNPNAGNINTAVTSGTSTGLDPLATAQLSEAIKTTYSNPIKNYINQLMVSGPANYAQNVGDTNAYYSALSQQSADTTQGQVNVLGQQQAGNTALKQLSLAQLADSIRGQNQGFQNALGNTGAGSSSAVQMGEYAYGKEQAKEQSSINLNTAVNNQNLQAQIDADLKNGVDVQQVIGTQKKQTLDNITQTYQNNIINLQNQLSTAVGSQARDQIYYTKQALDATTLADLQSLNDNVNAATTAYTNSINSGNQVTANAPMATAPTTPGATLPLPSPNLQGSTQGLSQILNR